MNEIEKGARTLKQERNNDLFYVAVIAILILRICSYFMLSEEVVITQVMKVMLRVSTTFWVLLIAGNNTHRQKTRLGFEFALSPILYITYLMLGVASLFWTSSFKDSILHLLMDAETLFFSYLFIRLISTRNINTPENPIRLSKTIATAIFLISTVFVLGMIVMPEKFYRFTHGGEEARLGGFIINPNELGMLIAIGIATTFLELKSSFNKIFKWVMMALLLYALILTGSRSSMAGLFIILIFFASQSKTARMRAVIIGCMVVAAPYIFLQLFIKQGDLEEVMNMTGRIPFWKDLLCFNFPKEPFLGYGYMRIDYSDKFESFSSYAGAMTHNTFLQVLIGLGLVGLFIIICQMAATIHAMSATNDSQKKRLAIALFIPVLINSFTEFGIFGETNYGILFYLFIVFSLSLKPVGSFVRIKHTNAADSNPVFRPSIIT